MNRSVFSSLRTRIIILVLLAVLPAWVIMVHTFFEQRRMKVAQIQQNTLEVARFVAQEDEQFLQSTRETLLTLAHFLSLYGDNLLQCNLFFAKVLQQLNSYINFGAALPNGEVFCAANPLALTHNLADQLWFRQVLGTRDFVVGDFQKETGAHSSVLLMAYPLYEFGPSPRAVVFTLIDVGTLNPFRFDLESQLPPGSTLELVVESGTVLAQRPKSKHPLPSSVEQKLLAETLRTGNADVIEAAGPDGVPSLYAIAPIKSGLRRSRVYILFRVPTNSAFADAQKMLIRNVSLLAIVAVLAILAAWFGGNAFIVRQVHTIADTSRRLAGGDLKARTGLQRTRGELGTLARAFDDMAARLEEHQEQERTSRQLLSKSREQLRQLASHLETIREEERTQMAREIHDNLGQAMTALKLDLAWLSKRMNTSPEQAKKKVYAMSELIDGAIATVQRVSAELRPGALDDLGLAAAIEWQAEEFEERTGIRCAVYANTEGERLSEEQATAIFRILQEALTNVARHSQASEVHISFQEQESSVRLEIEDNGVGLPEHASSDPTSYGLIGIRERVYPWGGKMEIAGVPGTGTTLSITLPFTAQHREEDVD